MSASANETAAALNAPATVTTTEVRAPGHEWWRKPLRTGVQLAMGGVLTAIVGYLVQHYGPSFPPGVWAVALAVATQLTSMAQNYGEARGWIAETIVPPSPTVVKVTTTQNAGAVSVPAATAPVIASPFPTPPEPPAPPIPPADALPPRMPPPPAPAPHAAPDSLANDPAAAL